MMPGEQSHQAVFTLAKSAFGEIKNIEKESIESFEMLVVLRVMFELGYVAKNSDIEIFMKDNNWDNNILKEVSISRNILIAVINKAIKESQL